MDFSLFLPPILGYAALAAVMALLWRRQQRTRNAGVVDLAWTGGLAGLAVLYAACAPGWPPRRALVAGLICLWALRLGCHLVRRLRREPEDGRYAELRARLGSRAQTWLFLFFQLQALLAALLSLPFWLLCRDPRPAFSPLELAGLGLWISAFAGEAWADRQLRRWRSDPANAGRTCRAGLWRYSRHPNYFCEWLLWIAYALMASSASHGWISWYAPALMLFLILKVTGVPPTEAQALRSRGDDYRNYQLRTNAFFPGPPRSA